MRPAVRLICERVAANYELSVQDIVGRSRLKSVAEARNIAMWIARRMLSMSYPELGLEFGRDHTTVMSGVKRVELANGPLGQTRQRLYADMVRGSSYATGAREIEFGSN